MWTATGRLVAALAFGGAVAAAAILVGAGDLEGYEHGFVSLDRGTAIGMVRVLGQPVYTPALGLGVRLPVYASLGASPAALIAPYLPQPLTYALLLTFAIAAAVLVMHHALVPAGGRLLSWVAAFVLFCSVPMVTYTISGDWPETVVTYCAYIGGVCAPHAMLALLQSARSRAERWVGVLSVTTTAWALVSVAHAAHWPLLAIALVLTGLLALCRREYPWQSRVAVVAGLAAAAFTAVAFTAVDLLRELDATVAHGDTDRAVDSVSLDVLASNLFPFGDIGARVPFSFLLLAAVSIPVALLSPHRHMRVATIGSAVASMALAFGTTALVPRGSVPWYAPPAPWMLRDPAGVFAVLAGAWAAAAAWRWHPARPLLPVRWAALAALLVAALQGPAYAVRLVMPELVHEESWTRDWTPRRQRASARGLAPHRAPPGERLALWPGVRDRMRGARLPSTDFADAGYLLVNAWTKQRTMRGLIDNNGVVFNQAIEPTAAVLCDAQAVEFLRLRYLLRPADEAVCSPWSRVPDLRVDDVFDVDATSRVDRRVRALPVARVDEALAQQPALAPGSQLLRLLVPMAGSSLAIEPSQLTLRLDEPDAANGQALVLPIAHDPAWRPSSGEVRDVGGLLALVGVDQAEVRLEFVPDFVAVLRALSMTLAQVLGLAGMIGLAVAQVTSHKSQVTNHKSQLFIDF
jgi:hypothetical protein